MIPRSVACSFARVRNCSQRYSIIKIQVDTEDSESYPSNMPPSNLLNFTNNFSHIAGDFITVGRNSNHGQETCILYCSYLTIQQMKTKVILPYRPISNGTSLERPPRSLSGDTGDMSRYSQTRAEQIVVRVGPSCASLSSKTEKRVPKHPLRNVMSP